MKADILGVKIDQVDFDSVLTLIKSWVKEEEQKTIVTINPEFLVATKQNEEFKRILNSADLATCDGFGLSLAGLFLHGIRMPRVTGSDLSRQLLNDPELKIFLLGSTDAVLAEMNNKFVQGNIVGSDSGGRLAGNYELENNSAVIEKIKASGANLLLVAFGQIKQEIWIHKNLKSMPNIKVAIGVGGTFDFLSGKIKRAPKWMRNLGLEWLYRLAKEPKRLRRIWQATIVFSYYILKEKLK